MFCCKSWYRSKILFQTSWPNNKTAHLVRTKIQVLKQIGITIHLFYRKKFKYILFTLINLWKDNSKILINTIMPLYKIFSFPFKKENISFENIQNVFLILPPKSYFTKCNNFKAIQAELDILKNAHWFRLSKFSLCYWNM